MNQKLSYDIVIVGGGIAGSSLAYHLHNRGYRNCLLIDSPKVPAVSQNIPGFVVPGWPDNFTRMSHVRGMAIAGTLWNCGIQAKAAVKAFCQKNKISIQEGRRLRLATSQMEAEEMAKAVLEMRECRIDANLINLKSSRLTRSQREDLRVTQHVWTIQEEYDGSFAVDRKGLFDKLKVPSLQTHLDHVNQITISREGVELNCDRQERIHAQCVILAAGVATVDLSILPDGVLVPYVDQWHALEVKEWGKTKELLKPGTFISTQHGYHWGVVRNQKEICLGGARYLRPLAGIGTRDTLELPAIRQKLIQEFEMCFEGLKLESSDKKGCSLLDLIPCDEMPVIGPMFGQPRILVATGFMGYGLSFGFWAGLQLAKLIDLGICEDLPRIFWPERFRSLED